MIAQIVSAVPSRKSRFQHVVCDKCCLEMPCYGLSIYPEGETWCRKCRIPMRDCYAYKPAYPWNLIYADGSSGRTVSITAALRRFQHETTIPKCPKPMKIVVKKRKLRWYPFLNGKQISYGKKSWRAVLNFAVYKANEPIRDWLKEVDRVERLVGSTNFTKYEDRGILARV